MSSRGKRKRLIWQAKRNAEYWKNRQIESKISSINSAINGIREMKNTFRSTKTQLEAAMQEILSSVDGSLANAKRILSSRELAAYRKHYKKLIATANSLKAAAPKAEQLLDWLYKAERVNRFDAQLAQIDILSAQLYGDLTGGIASRLIDGAEESYYRVFHALETKSGEAYHWNTINERQLNVLASENWSGQRWDNRLWGHVSSFDKKLKDIITRGVLTGSSIDKMKLELANLTNQKLHRCETLIRTEMAHITETATAMGYEETGVEQYRFLSTLDLKTSEICRRLDGLIVDLANRKEGFNYPPMHPNCRSTTIPYYAEDEPKGLRAARDPVTGERMEVPSDWSYEEWYERRVKNANPPNYRKIELALRKSTDPQTIRDISYYDRYKKRIKTDMPALDKFIQIKRADNDEWKQLQKRYRYDGIVDRLLTKHPTVKVFNDPEEIFSEYSDAAFNLPQKTMKDGLFHYSHYGEGVKMNKYLGKVPGITMNAEELRHLKNTHDALNNMYLPYDTVLWRGTNPQLLIGYDSLPDDISEWKGEQLLTKGYTSTSILRSSAYDAEVQMVIVAPSERIGAGYINEISYNKTHSGDVEGLYELKEEYEALLQNDSRYTIIEAQKFDGKTFLVVEWKGAS